MKVNGRRSVWLFLFCFTSLIQLAAQKQDSTIHLKQKSFFRQNLLVPAMGVGLGLYSRISGAPLNKYEVDQWRRKRVSGFHTSADDYLQFVPIATVYGMHFAGVNSGHSFMEKSIGLGCSQVMALAMVHSLKYLIADQRPGNGAFNAFPSGHTAEAFMAAQFLWKEYGRKSPFVAVFGYSCAAATGVLRVFNGRHWSADVLAGAGIGILSVNLGYLCLNWYKKHHIKGSFLRFH